MTKKSTEKLFLLQRYSAAQLRLISNIKFNYKYFGQAGGKYQLRLFDFDTPTPIIPKKLKLNHSLLKTLKNIKK